MGGAASKVAPRGQDAAGNVKVKGARATLKMSAIPRLKVAEGDDNASFLGVTLDYGAVMAPGAPPAGFSKCTCAPLDCAAVEALPDLHLTEYIEEEAKWLNSFLPNRLRSGPTARGARFAACWFHPDNAASAPPAVRAMVPRFADGEWVEDWHATHWIKFEDPYTHIKSRFRFWRRLERTKLKPQSSASTPATTTPGTPSSPRSPA